MFLILGSPRSGTSLMRAALNQHPDILVPEDADFVVPASMICERVKDEAVGRAMVADVILQSNRHAVSIAPYLTPGDVRGVVNRAPYSGMAIAEAVYDSIAQKHGKGMVGAKSSEDLSFLDVLLGGGLLERPIKVIQLVRDVRDVVLSLSRSPLRPPFLEMAYPFEWSRMNLVLHRSMRDLPERHLLVRFDDMVLDAPATFRSVADFLGVKFHSAMLAHAERGGEASGDVLVGRVGVWKREMAPERSRAIFERAREAICQLGWEEPQRESPPADRVATSARAVDGTVEHSRWSARLRRRSGRRLRIDALHPPWTVTGARFNTQQDGRSHIAVEGSGFGHSATLVLGGRSLETVHASGRILSAPLPEDFLGRPGVLSVWVDNRDRVRSSIHWFPVLTARAAAAFGPPSGRGRVIKGAFNRLARLALATSWRMRVPLFHLQREWAELRSRMSAAGSGKLRPLPALSPEVAAHVKPVGVPRKPDVICFPIIDWDFRYQRPQQILSRLAQSGHRIFYLSQQLLAPDDETFRLRPLTVGVTEVFLQSPSPLNVYKDALKGGVEEGLYRSLLDFKEALGLVETICFVNLPFWTPLALRLKADFGFRIVFDCLDDFSGFRDIGSRMLELERELAARADLVTTTSRLLATKHAARTPLLVPNAADYAHFAAPTPPALRLDKTGPVVGYYGAISHWFDADLIARAARARPDWQFVLIGRTDREIQARLRAVPSIRLLAELPYDDLPGHLAAFDVCIIPFIMDDLVKATNPVKFFEYLSAGKPVVAARMPELEAFSSECFLYDDLQGFLDQVETALAQKDDPRRIEARRAVARTNTWEARCHVLGRAFHGLYPRASVIVVTYNGLPMTKACVESLLEKTAYTDWELILVDNASSDGTPAYLRSLSERHPFVRMVLNDTNRGFAAANNQGIQISTGRFVVLLNNDTVVTLGWLGRLLRHLADTDIGLVGPVTNNIGNEARIRTAYGDMAEMEAFAAHYTRQHIGQSFDIPMLAMFCVAIRRSVLDEAGMLDERYEVGMFEDDDLSRTLKTRGYRIVCAEDVFVHHVGGGAFRTLDPDVYQAIFDSNRRRYEEKWGEPWVPHRDRRSTSVPRMSGRPMP